MTKIEKRSLISVLYSGEVITTPWPREIRMSLASQMHQANQHREKVRDRLYVTSLNRLSADYWWAA